MEYPTRVVRARYSCSSVSTSPAPTPILVPLLCPNADVPPAIDEVLTTIAREASLGNIEARNALYAAFEPKIARMVRRQAMIATRTAACRAIESDDIAQEAFIVFANLVTSWPGSDSFAAYFHGHFPWALKNAARRMEIENRSTFVVSCVVDHDYLGCESADAEEAIALLRTVAAAMPEPDGAILLWRIKDGEGFDAIARRLGTGRRTAMRAWERIAADLRRSYAR